VCERPFTITTALERRKLGTQAFMSYQAVNKQKMQSDRNVTVKNEHVYHKLKENMVRHLIIQSGRQSISQDTQTDRQTNKQTDRQTDKHTLKDRQTDKK
jgi:hypothetical protein